MTANRITRWIGPAAVFALFVAGIIVLMLWLAGSFSPKTPSETSAARTEASDVERRLTPVRLVRLPVTESAVGTIRAVHETTIGSKLLARVVELNLKAGQKVQAGDVLMRLDDTDLRAKLQQAKAAVAAAEAVRNQAAADEKRYAQLVGSKAISRQEYEKAVTALRSAEADLLRARDRQRIAGHAGLDHHPLADRRNGDRQKSRRRRHGDARPNAGHAL